MSGYWVRFAATGDPNEPGAPPWPAYDPETRTFLELGDRIETGTGVGSEHCDLFDELLERDLDLTGPRSDGALSQP